MTNALARWAPLPTPARGAPNVSRMFRPANDNIPGSWPRAAAQAGYRGFFRGMARYGAWLAAAALAEEVLRRMQTGGDVANSIPGRYPMAGWTLVFTGGPIGHAVVLGKDQALPYFKVGIVPAPPGRNSAGSAPASYGASVSSNSNLGDIELPVGTTSLWYGTYALPWNGTGSPAGEKGQLAFERWSLPAGAPSALSVQWHYPWFYDFVPMTLPMAYPALDPMAVPIGVPMPSPRPLPFRFPTTRPWPVGDPLGDPVPKPAPKPKPVPVPVPVPIPGSVSVPAVEQVAGRRGLGFSYHALRRPVRGEKEAKRQMGGRAAGVAWAVANAVTEGLDAMDYFWWALPKNRRTPWANPVQKFGDLMDFVSDLVGGNVTTQEFGGFLTDSFVNATRGEVTDRMYGKMWSATNRMHRAAMDAGIAPHSPVGLGAGPWDRPPQFKGG